MVQGRDGENIKPAIIVDFFSETFYSSTTECGRISPKMFVQIAQNAYQYVLTKYYRMKTVLSTSQHLKTVLSAGPA
jgi:hypothetical protein